jgi:hypothetical protein
MAPVQLAESQGPGPAFRPCVEWRWQPAGQQVRRPEAAPADQ